MPDGASALQLVFGGDAALYTIVAREGDRLEV